MVGYHGESSRSRNQRHSATCFSATQVGRANAPARWATEVSQVTTRSSAPIAAAVSTKPSGPASKSSPSVSTRMPAGRSASCSTPSPTCSEISLTPGSRRAARKRRAATERADVGFGIRIALPDDADLEALGADARRPFARALRFGGEIGDSGRHAVEPGGESARQAADGDLSVEALRPAAVQRRGGSPC